MPDLFKMRGTWSHPRALDAFTSTLDELDIQQATMIGHSFGGGIELGFAAGSRNV